MDNRTVTRFAPSPTGFMHIGNLRTALYAWLIAKAEGGKFILRIEDTDRQRLIPGSMEVIIDTLKAAHLTVDEGPNRGGENGPYIQSERLPIYKEYAEKLVKIGHAYYCFCDKTRLEALHEEDANGGYDGHCRNLTEEEVARKLSENTPYVIRQKMPQEGTTSYTDMVFGEISVDNSELTDQILLKADGFPTYNFAHVVDDYLMGVTHVVRGSEYLSSTPKYVLLYDFYGWPRPKYVHLPLLMGKNANGSISKLSKRHGAVSFADLTAQGYLPEAIVNYIAFLGWSPKETNEEVFTLEELTEIFSIEGINKSPSVFDYDKLIWFNEIYLRKTPFEEFAELAAPFIPEQRRDFAGMEKILRLIQPRIGKLEDIEGASDFFFNLPDYDKTLYINKKNKTTPENCLSMLINALDALKGLEDWSNDGLFACLKELSEKTGVKAGAMMWAVRVAVSGLSVTPGGATELMEVMGKETSIERIEKAIAMLEA
ncbi:MAG: glutamate--tRNA ligase [Eubacteriaceae bacterium]|nr:glutamate--tRNA ligase [Eubacteriaceae bacterium]